MSDSPGARITVVIPAHNEARRIRPTLEAWTEFAASRPGEIEVIVVDDGSDDATSAVTREVASLDHCVRLLPLKENRGKGFAIRAGMVEASGQFVCYTDADLPVDPAVLPKFLAALRNTPAEVAIAVRPSVAAVTNVPFWRRLGSVAFRWLVKTVVLPEVSDSQCGFKVFDRGAVEPLIPSMRIDGFAFDIELIRVSLDAGLRLAEVPVRIAHRAGSTVRIWRDAPPMLRDMLRIALRRTRRRQPQDARWTGTYSS